MRGKRRAIVHDMYEEFSPVFYEHEETNVQTPTAGNEQRGEIINKVWKQVPGNKDNITGIDDEDNEPDTAVA